MHDRQEELKYHEKALEIRRRLFGERHPDVADSLSDLGDTYGELGHHEQAIEHHSRSLALLKELLGEHHRNTVVEAVNLTICLTELGRRYQAFQLLHNLLMSLPGNHSEYAEVWKMMKWVLSQPLRRGFQQPSMNKYRRPAPRAIQNT